MHCDICKRPIASGDICDFHRIRTSELKAVYRLRAQAVIERQQQPVETTRVPLSAFGMVDTWIEHY